MNTTTNLAMEYSFGDGVNYNFETTGRGLCIGVKCRVLSMTLDVGEGKDYNGFAAITVALVKDGTVSTQLQVTAEDNNNTAVKEFTGTTEIFLPGEVINFRTMAGIGKRALVTAWFERII